MRQYLTIKAEHPGSVLLFRMGDFWETFYEDAALVSRVLGIVLTTRGMEKGEPVPLAGVPLSSLETSVAKLVAAGHRVAICDQVEDPKQAKGIVKRDVVEVVSAGTATLPGLLEERVSRWLVAIRPDAPAGRVGIARCDVTTGELVGSEVTAASLADELDRLGPAEILLPEGELPPEVARAVKRDVPLEKLPPAAFRGADEAADRVREGPGLAEPHGESPLFLPLAVTAAAALLDYLDGMRKAEAGQLTELSFDESEGTMILDEISLRNLEILRPLHEGAGDATLLSVLDRTRTPMGGRLLRTWLGRPLLSPERIAARHEAVEELARDADLRSFLAETLDRVGDVARIAMRVAAGRAHGRDLVGLADSLERMPAMRERLGRCGAAIFGKLAGEISDFSPEVETIREAIVDEPPLALKEGGVVRGGFSEELDRLRGLSRSGKDWIAELQAKERERTGVTNLKIGYNRVFGYYLEVTKANRDLVPDDYERRQTLVNAERYVTPELKEREAEIVGADEKAKALEYELFVEVRDRLALSCDRIRKAGAALAALDVLLTFTEVASRRGWVRPVVGASDRLEIQGGRHPVVESSLPAHEFVPNDTVLGAERQILLITGPNMAGKSTYLRQVALIVILAQTGSFGPADAAQIGIVDRIFTRVGASDFVARGHSTFMVEMVEVSRILAAATPKSLVLLDEVGRGTSTYDGLAIAWAVTEFLHERPERAARTLFATHYHELTELAEKLPRACNLRVTVHEWKDKVVFLRKVVEGAADRSFGIQVAQLAGVPKEVTKRAKKILGGLEDGTFLTGREASQRATGSQLDLFSASGASVLSELDALDPDSMTPMDALAVLSEWKRRVRTRDGEEES
jgi:DNA mismatch repair protein MutS